MSEKLLDAVTATGAGSWFHPKSVPFSIQFVLSDTTTPAANVTVQLSNDKVIPLAYGSAIALSGALATDAIRVSTPCEYVRCYVNTLTGTSAALTATASYTQTWL